MLYCLYVCAVPTLLVCTVYGTVVCSLEVRTAVSLQYRTVAVRYVFVATVQLKKTSTVFIFFHFIHHISFV